MSPGPAVLYTIGNALNHSLKETFIGILGVASGILLVAIFATFSLIFAAQQFDFAFLIISSVGSVYFMYLSFTKWQFQPKKSYLKDLNRNSFYNGVLISLLNPKALAFFIFIFPLYIDNQAISIQKCIFLSLLFSFNVITVHSLYTFITTRLTHSFELSKLTHLFDKISAVLFFIFGTLLLKQTIDLVSNLLSN